ncbi:hypothetical protein G9A89_013088 [Geosiphon pyriformis]|nr:hypothetical protein G9A89_013088 [Geosiphon pyriformis]
MSSPMFFSETLLPEKPLRSEEHKSSGGPPTKVSSANRIRPRRNKHQRKKQRTNSPQDYDFLVFGYEAKAFRDDEMAQKINEGQLLIPWRGEESTEKLILLDRIRYRLDVMYFFGGFILWKNPLFAPFFCSFILRYIRKKRCSSHMKGAHKRWSNLATESVVYSFSPTEEEIEEEKLCNEERWMDLDSDAEEMHDLSEEERGIYIEEKRKRLNIEEKNNEFSYDYSEETHQELSEKIQESNDQNDNLEYTPKFIVPRKMATPTSVRVDEIIERTAKFLNASNDPQIEIVLQAKQANNPSFSFLNKDDPLYPYYKHVRLLLQTGLFAYGNNSDDNESSEAEEDNEKLDTGSFTEKLQDSDQQKTKDENLESKKTENLMNNKEVIDQRSGTPPPPPPPPPPSSPPKPYGPVVTPTADLQAVIDELAVHIAKSDVSVESKIRGQHIDDPQYSFLLPWNEFNPYYKFKIQSERKLNEKIKKEEQSKKQQSAGQMNGKNPEVDEGSEKQQRWEKQRQQPNFLPVP